MQSILCATPFKKQDLSDLIPIFIDAFSASPWFDEWDSFTAEAYLKELIQNPFFLGFCVTLEKKVIGACFGHQKTWYQGNIYVIDEFFIDIHQKEKGIGSYLMNYLKHHLSTHQINTIQLVTGSHFPARFFYEKHGFQIDSPFIQMSVELPK